MIQEGIETNPEIIPGKLVILQRMLLRTRLNRDGLHYQPSFKSHHQRHLISTASDLLSPSQHAQDAFLKPPN
jgi:hypothetical protein